MEYIHKAKAEKSRTKVLNDQMEARRTKNKVLYLPILGYQEADLPSPFRQPGNVAPRGSPRRGKRSCRWKRHPQRSKRSSYNSLSHVFVTVVRYASHAPRQPPDPHILLPLPRDFDSIVRFPTQQKSGARRKHKPNA